MRKYAAFALTAFLSLVCASYAFARDDIQTIKARVTPSKLDANEFKNAKIAIDIRTVADDELSPALDQPPSATRTQVDFPKNLKFNTKAAPNCKVSSSSLFNTTTTTAVGLCGKKSIVSLSSGTRAEVQIDPAPTTPGSTPLIVPVQVTAFNGKEKNALYLHARADSVNNTTLLIGKLKKGPKGYKTTLDVSIPPLLAGAISDFQTTVKSGGYVQARCKQKSATYQARTTYENHPSTEATSVVKCKQKKSKGGKKGK